VSFNPDKYFSIALSVEDRPNVIEQTLGLVMLVARGMERADDPCMDPDDRRAAWSHISNMTDDAMESFRALAAGCCRIRSY